MNGKMFDADVAVIGAGVAGLAAFDRLLAAGCDAMLIEARERIGGRVYDDYPAGWPLPVELGAEFIHGSPPELAALAAPDAEAQEAWMATPNGLYRAEDAGADPDAIFERMRAIAPPAPDCSFSQVLAGCSDLPVEARERARSFIEGFEAADAGRISVYSLNRERASSAEDDEAKTGAPRRPRGGYGPLLAQLSGGMRSSAVEKVWLGTAVRRVAWRPGEVEIEASAARAEEAHRWRVRRAIVTLPLSLLQQSLGSGPDRVRFEPPLAAKRSALEKLVMGGARRVTLRLREPVWERTRGASGERLTGLGFLFGAGAAGNGAKLTFPVWWTAPNSSLAAAQITGWAAGPRVTALAGVAPETVAQRAIGELAHLLRLEETEIQRVLIAAHTHDWQTDPWSLGAYSYAAVGGLNAPAELAAPLDGTLFFAGEATDNTGQHATVHGALRSGRRAANEALRG